MNGKKQNKNQKPTTRLSSKLRFTRISTRITALLALILVLTVGFYTLFMVIYKQCQSQRLLNVYANLLTETVEKSLRLHMMENRRDDTNQTIHEIKKNRGIQRVIIYDHKDGEIDYATESNLVGMMANIEKRPCLSCHGNTKSERDDLLNLFCSFQQNQKGEGLSTSVPIYNSRKCSIAPCHAHSLDRSVLGVLVVDLDPEVIQSGIRFSPIILLIAGSVVVIFTAIIVYLLLRHWVWRPVQEMVKGTRRIAGGNLEEPIPQGKAELGELAEAFNNMQAQLKLSQRNLIMCEKLASMGKLAAGVAHEINNPLTGILTFSESLLEDSKTDDPHRSDYEVIRGQAIRSRDIVKKILDFARQDEPNVKLSDINTMVKNTVDLVGRLSQFRNIQISLQLDENIPEILFDSGQMGQVILNMLINASEAIKGGGRIEISTKMDEQQNEAMIEVSDNGVGIPEENLTKIFDPFFSTKKNDKDSNSGLGLSVSWGIVEQHNGRIEVESNVGKGTTFKIILPARTE